MISICREYRRNLKGFQRDKLSAWFTMVRLLEGLESWIARLRVPSLGQGSHLAFLDCACAFAPGTDKVVLDSCPVQETLLS